MSPICQMCSLSFSFLTRAHHCRNCGKSICSNCSKYCRLDILGYIDVQRVCFQCITLVEETVSTVMDIRKKGNKSSIHENLYDLPYNQSVLLTNLKA